MKKKLRSLLVFFLIAISSTGFINNLKAVPVDSIHADITPLTCYMAGDGAIDITVYGGTSPYSYYWNDGSSMQDRSNLAQGNYSVTVYDNDGHSASASYLVPQPGPLSLESVVTAVSCYGGNNGAINLTVSGGTTPYSFAWSNGGNTEDISSLTSGIYGVTVTDINACSLPAEIMVPGPGATFTLTINTFPVSCYGGNNGTVLVNPDGGTAPYSYLWNDGAVTQNRTDLAAGEYYVTVTDGQGLCSAAPAVVSQPADLLVASSLTPVTCNATPTGIIDLTVSGGTSPYYYSWSNGSTSQDLNGVPAGSYSVTVTDNHGCINEQGPFLLSEPPVLSLSFTQGNVTCYNGQDGNIDITVNGGVLPYAFLWNNGNTQSSLSGLTAGTYTVTVTDANNCQIIQAVEITQPSPVDPHANIHQITCFGAGNGHVILSPTGGNPPFTYAWSNGASTSYIMNLQEGNYSVTITDTYSCPSIFTFSIQEPDYLWCGGVISDATCNGTSDGAVEITVFGGTAPYSFLWNDGFTMKDRSGLLAGTYTVTVTDYNNCTYSAPFTVHQPEILNATASISNVSCFNGNDGIINQSISGGTAPFSFLWDNAATTEDISLLTAGDYTVTIIDAHGCSTTPTYTVTQPELLTVGGTITQVSCPSGNNGAIQLQLQGGTMPATFLWNDNHTEGDRSGLTAGIYDVTVTDLLGCTATNAFTVTQPGVFAFNETITNLTCFESGDGTITLNMAGGTQPYDILWSTGATTTSVSSLSAGTYTVTITDNATCVYEQQFSVTQPEALSSSAEILAVSCNAYSNGQINLTTNGGIEPYSWSWSNASTTEDITGLTAGTYTVTITDSHNCFSTNSLTVNEPALLNVGGTIVDNNCYGGASGSISLSIIGGTSPFSYLWDDLSANPYNEGLTTGDYSVTVTDNNACTATATFTVGQPAEIVALTATLSPVSCNNGNDGAVDLAVSGGTPDYTYLWSNSYTSQDITDLSAGVYSVTVYDNDNHCSVATFEITQPDAFSVTSALTSPLCNGNNNGAIDITVGGGSSPYEFAWSGGETTEDLNNITAGNYDVTITDDNGCDMVYTVELTQPLVMEFTSVATNISCFESSDGSIAVLASGGTPDYQYTWSNGVTSTEITGLNPDTYALTVTDDNGCTATGVFEITQPAALLLTEDAIIPSTCHNGDDGAISLTTSGGTLDYTYLWSDDVTTEDRTSLSDGEYSVTVTDANGCLATGTYTVTAIYTLTLEAAIENVSCLVGASGSITLNVGGGTEPYSFVWNDGSSDQNRTNLTPGEYTVTVTDMTGCVETATFTVDQINGITITGQVTNLTCFGVLSGSITVSGDGGEAPYEWQWSTGALGETINQLAAGFYTVTVTDVNGCFTIETFEVTQPAPVTGTLNPSSQVLYCSGDTLTPVVFLADNYPDPVITYTWSRNKVTEVSGLPGNGTGVIAGVLTNNTFLDQHIVFNISVYVNGCFAGSYTAHVYVAAALSMNITFEPLQCNGETTVVQVQPVGGVPPLTGAQTLTLGAGTYTFTVSDSYNCTATQTLVITEPPAIYISGVISQAYCSNQNNAGIEMTITGGTPPYSYLWPDGNTNEDRTSLYPGSYTVTVTDDNDCIKTRTFIVGSFYNAPMGNMVGSPIGCYGQANPVYIYLSGTPPWNFSYKINNTTYNVPNIYTSIYTIYATLTDTTTFELLSLNDLHCVGTVTSQPFTMIPVPLPSATLTPPQAICKGETSSITVHLNGTPPFSLTWYNGTPHTVNNIYSNTYTIVSTPQVTTQYSIQSLSDVYCSSGTTVTPVTQIVYPLPTAIISGNPAVCAGNSAAIQVGFTGNPPWSFVYNDGSGNHTISNINTTPYNLILTPSVTTYYTLVSVHDYRCTGSVSGQAAILVHPRPTATWTGPDSACYNTDISLGINLTGTPPWNLTWNDGTPHTVSNIMFTPFMINSHMTVNKTFAVTQLSDAFCTANSPAHYGQPKTVTIHQLPTGILTGPTMNCYGVSSELQVNLTGSPPWSISWYDGLTIHPISDITQSPYLITVDPSETTTYYLTAVADAFCPGQVLGSSVTLSVLMAPDMNIIGLNTDNSVCEGSGLTLATTFAAGNGPFTLHYLDATGELITVNNLETDSTLTFMPPAIPGTYVFTLLSVSSIDGCELPLNQSFNITVIPAPQISAGNDSTITLGENVVLQGSISGGIPPFNVFWTPSDYLDDPGILNPTCTPLADITYTLHVIDSIGCEVFDEVNITVDMSRNIFGYITYDNSLATPLNNVKVKALNSQNDVVDSTYSNQEGLYLLNNLPDESYHLVFSTEIPFGGVNATDALLTLKHYVHLQLLTGFKIPACDIDGSGFINAVDALSISRRFTQQINTFPIGDWYFQNISFSIPTSVAQFDVKALCTGDANGSYEPLSKRTPSLTLTSEGEISSNDHGLINLPVVTDRPAEAGAISLILNYPENMVAIHSVTLYDGSEVNYTATEGVLRISWYDLQPLKLDAGALLLNIGLKLLNENTDIDQIFELTEASEIADGQAIPLSAMGLVVPKVRNDKADVALSVNYPNPFSHITRIDYSIPAEGRVKVTVLDALGRVLDTPVEAIQIQGKHTLTFDGSKLPEGIYIYRLEYNNGVDDYSLMKKMTLLR